MANSSNSSRTFSTTTTAVILAGGLGTRLRGVVSDRPKVLASVQGRPFIEYLLDQINAAGLRSVTLCIGHMADQIEKHLGTSYKSLQLSYSREKELLGTAGALRLALPLITTQSVLLMNGDSYCDIDIAAFAAWHVARKATISVALTEVQDTSRYGQVEIDAHGAITAFKEKATSGGIGVVNAGIYMIERSLIESVPPQTVCSLEREVFPAHLGKGLCGWIAPHTIFIDIGTPDSYSTAQGLF